MPKFRYVYMYHKLRKLFYRLRVYHDDKYEYKLIHSKYRTSYYFSNHIYSELVTKEGIAIGKLKTLRLLYDKR